MRRIRRVLGRRDACVWILFTFVSLIVHPGALSAAPDWQASLSKEPPGSFPLPRPLRGRYVFGWSGFTAATADIQFARPAPDRTQLQGSGHTPGFVRALWKNEGTYK